MNDRPSEEFARQAEADKTGLIAEFVEFLKHNKKWWLAPVIVVMLLVGLMVFVGGSALAPFLYALW